MQIETKLRHHGYDYSTFLCCARVISGRLPLVGCERHIREREVAAVRLCNAARFPLRQMTLRFPVSPADDKTLSMTSCKLASHMYAWRGLIGSYMHLKASTGVSL
jgi:hypothetical protein